MNDEIIGPNHYTINHLTYICERWKHHMGGRINLNFHPIVYADKIGTWSMEQGDRVGSFWTDDSKIQFHRYGNNEGHLLPEFNENMSQNDPQINEAITAGNRWRTECIKELARHFSQLEGIAASPNND